MLKAVQRRIASGRDYFLCNALGKEALNTGDYVTANRLRAYVQRSLRGEDSLEYWIKEYRPKLKWPCDFRGIRVQWVQWMIDSLEGKN